MSPFRPLHSRLVSLSLIPWGEEMSMPNPFTSCGDFFGGSALISVYGFHTWYFLVALDIVGGELLSGELLSGRGHLLLWTRLIWPQDILATMLSLSYRHVLGSQHMPVSDYRLVTTRNNL